AMTGFDDSGSGQPPPASAKVPGFRQPSGSHQTPGFRQTPTVIATAVKPRLSLRGARSATKQSRNAGRAFPEASGRVASALRDCFGRLRRPRNDSRGLARSLRSDAVTAGLWAPPAASGRVATALRD